MNILSRLTKIEKAVDNLDLDEKQRIEVFATKDDKRVFLYSFRSNYSQKLYLEADDNVIRQWKDALQNPTSLRGYPYDVQKILESFGELHER